MWAWLVDRFETPYLLATLGALIGLAFGYFGQRSRFCLRAATIEFAERQWGQRTTVWLITFSVAVMGTQLAIASGWFDTANVRQLASVGSLSGAILWAIRSRLPRGQIGHAIGAGAVIVVAWIATYQLSLVSFDPVPVRSLTFTSPSANVLMTVLATATVPLDFDFFFIPAVLLGAFLAAWHNRELELQGFQGGHAMKRYLAGAVLMGFGGILAGGCAVGAGVTGASLFSLTSWLTLLAMWVGGIVTHRLVDGTMRAT
ncbi:YeeE/YedE thiosulfate transporter family protein [Hydrogenophilus thermoluteolus]|uniref:Uncharacterized protein n=1 Tax=Hydrogenophilus thermoluteolus TaxID=297 RepID=A0A2Z6DVH9_HYDTE|nr:YeeE/YedE thiosulfate transporter family protein [Hydrogenophilus thermoluteolus]BBD76368.1 hypothetical protein HPTL_0098 [Hydrogenophilus thermoluteolus]